MSRWPVAAMPSRPSHRFMPAVPSRPSRLFMAAASETSWHQDCPARILAGYDVPPAPPSLHTPKRTLLRRFLHQLEPASRRRQLLEGLHPLCALSSPRYMIGSPKLFFMLLDDVCASQLLLIIRLLDVGQQVQWSLIFSSG
jgi:hypothetical protein